MNISWLGKKPESFSMPDAEYSLPVTESSALQSSVLPSASKPNTMAGARPGAVDVATTALEPNGRLAAPPKLGSEQTPIELLTPHADETVFAKERAGRNEMRCGKLRDNSKEAIHKPVDDPSA